MSPALLEKHILSKPYFDRHGLIVATDHGRPVGFVHAGFGPTADLATISYEVGATCMLMVGPHHERRQEIAQQLLQHSEHYLIQHGASLLQAGGLFPVNPFYLGLYGGSRLPGILVDDQGTLELFRQFGYQQVRRQRILQCPLTGFRPPVNRQQMTVRRRYQVSATIDPIPESWWEACTLGHTDRIRFVLQDRRSGSECGSVIFWDMEPLASAWGVRAMGLFDLQIESGLRREGLGTFLIGESLRQLQTQGITLAEIQIPQQDSVTSQLVHKLGFEPCAEGIVLQKPAENSEDSVPAGEPSSDSP